MLSVTNVGLSAIANAQAGGFLINLSQFSVSETDVSALTDLDKINAEGLQGMPVYSAAVTSIEVVDTSAVRLTLTIPATVPKSGTWSLREIGVFLESGELFAYGPLEPAYDKDSSYAVRIYVLVVANRLGQVINVVVSQNNSLPAAPYVSSLVPPSQSYQNAVIVLDENTNDYQDASSASIAVKTGPGGAQWGFLDHNRIYSGQPESIVDASTFKLSSEVGGFWLNDEEVVIGQIVSGPGTGYSRKLKFTKATNSFTVIDKNWSIMAPNSRVAIWRNLKNQLPTRYPGFEEYLVLGVGVNTWQQTRTTDSKTRYTMKFISGQLNGSGSFSDPGLAGAEDLTTFIFIDGKCLNYGAYVVAGSALLASGKANKFFDAYIFIPTTSAIGGNLAKFETSFPIDGLTTRFYLPIVPFTTDWVEAYLGDNYVPKSLYTFEDTSIVFATPPTAGPLKLVCFANYDDAVTSSEIKRYFYQAVQGAPLTFAVANDTVERNRSLVYVQGDQYSEADFSVSAGSITLLREPAYVDGMATVDITIFALKDSSTIVSQSGTNSGPVWTDPAGRMGPPNKLVPRVIAYTSDGERTDYPVYNVPRKAHILLIAGGAYQDHRNLTYVKGDKVSQFGLITLSEPVPFGVKLDFICFTDVEDVGTATVCEVFNFTTTTSLTYQINPVSDPEAIITVIGGAYQHKGSYSITSGNTLNLTSVVPGLECEIWYFKSVEHLGWRTEMYVDFNTTGNINSYPLSQRVAREENTLVFADSVYQYKNLYKVIESNGMQQVVYDRSIPRDTMELPLVNMYFVSGEPLTRLLLRGDNETQYMPRNGPYVDWPNLSYKLRDMLACPMTKLLALMTGSMDMDFNNGTSNDQDLAQKYGLQPVTKTLTMDVLPTAAYAGIGSGAILGAKVSFNVFKYLEIYLKQELGSASFTIHTYEQGVKYFIDDIKLGELQYSALDRSQIPMITYDTGIYINYPNALTGVTYPGVPLLTNFLDMIWSRDHVTLPAAFTLGSTVVRTKTVSIIDDDSTQTRTFVHEIIDDIAGATYTIKWSRPYTTTDHNVETMVLVDGGGAPGYVQYFARLYAQWKYVDADIVKCMVYNKTSQANGGISDIAWPSWLLVVRGGSQGGNYPAVAGYTAGLTFGVTVDNYNASTGFADLSINMTSGTIGYSYFPAEMLMRSITIPVTYTIYPAIFVNPDGTVEPMLSNDDLFKSCCWTDFTPSPVLECGAGSGIIALPTVTKMITAEPKPVITGTYPYQSASGMSVTISGQTFVNGSSSALSVSNDTWALDLNQTTLSLVTNFYDVVVSVVLSDGSMITDATKNEIYVKLTSDSTPPLHPTVNIAVFNTQTPIITGTYPANDSGGGLTVSINGWAYSLGSNRVLLMADGLTSRTLSSNALTASGNNWSLDMSKDSINALNWQVHSVLATVADSSGNLASDTTSGEISLISPVTIANFPATGGGQRFAFDGTNFTPTSIWPGLLSPGAYIVGASGNAGDTFRISAISLAPEQSSGGVYKFSVYAGGGEPGLPGGYWSMSVDASTAPYQLYSGSALARSWYGSDYLVGVAFRSINPVTKILVMEIAYSTDYTGQSAVWLSVNIPI